MIPIRRSLEPLHVVVRFGDDIPLDAQGPALLAMEKALRAATGRDIRVHKDLMGDDSKLRVRMTEEERARL